MTFKPSTVPDEASSSGVSSSFSGSRALSKKFLRASSSCFADNGSLYDGTRIGSVGLRIDSGWMNVDGSVGRGGFLGRVIGVGFVLLGASHGIGRDAPFAFDDDIEETLAFDGGFGGFQLCLRTSTFDDFQRVEFGGNSSVGSTK